MELKISVRSIKEVSDNDQKKTVLVVKLTPHLTKWIVAECTMRTTDVCKCH